ncbi:MAG TPA: asparagine synthase (glutamine-hydrolyzing) [Bryobacteraceae bacterium]|jgi:asparagine synthase (glutamine-hydrolysing)
MCGICGTLTPAGIGDNEQETIRGMLGTIRHRGPDDEGVYIGSQAALGHRRLSIIDLGGGHQPLCNEDGTVWIAFNGEIYNFGELRRFLLNKGHVFKTQTDTETIVHLYEEFGPGCIEKLRGMFAFAIWDENKKTLLLARDRLGIKPLYYWQDANSLVFASEIKAILAHPAVDAGVAPELIDRFLTFLYLPGEETLLKGIRKLAAGHYLSIGENKSELRQYWDLRFSDATRARSMEQAKEELLGLLAESVDLHTIADVPVGVLLSGGVDSSAVLSFAAERMGKQIHTYTVGFSDTAVADERPYARLAAQTFGSQHRETTISADDFASFMPGYVWHMEEPVCEPPAIAMYYVSKLARNEVKVLLSGEGGDEAFAGYSNYRNLLWLERIKRALPSMNDAASASARLAGSLFHLPRFTKYAPLLGARFPDYYYSRTSNPYRYAGNGLGELYSPEFALSIDRERTLAPVRALQERVRGYDSLDAMLYIDTKTWLPDELLVKADKMTMANSLELRVPLLDHKVLEFAASLPRRLKIRGFTTKYLARKALAQRVPKAILNRPKAGFPVPYEGWLTKELRSWVREILTDRVTTNRGYFRRASMERMLSERQDGKWNAKEIFSLVTLELWHRAFA